MTYDTTKTPDIGARLAYYVGELLEAIDDSADWTPEHGTVIVLQGNGIEQRLEDVRRTLEDYQR